LAALSYSKRRLWHGERPVVRKLMEVTQQFSWRVGDKIWLKVEGERGLRGPYVISFAKPEEGKYRLTLEDGTVVNNGEEVRGEDLRQLQ
jgi:hypothetical protein